MIFHFHFQSNGDADGESRFSSIRLKGLPFLAHLQIITRAKAQLVLTLPPLARI
jgi:hypothetical protein